MKTTVFVKDLNDFATVNATAAVLITRAQRHLPGASCVKWPVISKDVKVEIEGAVRR